MEQHGSSRLVTIDDGRANALSTTLINDIDAAIADAESDAETRVLVLAGREGRFSGGFDLNVMKTGDASAITNLVCDGGALVRRLYCSTLPVIAACTGHAVAAGALMLLGCDRRIGVDGPVKIGLNEVAIGMVLPDWAMTLAKARISTSHLQRSIVTAELFDGAEAVRAGFLDVAVEPDAVVKTALAEADALAELDPSAYLKSLSVLRGDTLATMQAQIYADRATAR